MTMPGFNAEASIQKTVLVYKMAWGWDRLGDTVSPQLHCDEGCLDDCQSNCPDPGDCSDLPNPQARARCLRAAVACLRACRRKCCH